MAASHFQAENQKGPKLTASERRMIAELDRVRSLVGDGDDAQDVAKDEGYALARRYFDPKKDEYKPRFKKLLDKLKLKTRARGNNKLLRIAEYVSGGKLRGAKKTRFGQSLAACVHFNEKWTTLVAHYEGHDSKAIRAWVKVRKLYVDAMVWKDSDLRTELRDFPHNVGKLDDHIDAVAGAIYALSPHRVDQGKLGNLHKDTPRHRPEPVVVNAR